MLYSQGLYDDWAHHAVCTIRSMELQDETDKPNHYTVLGPAACSTILQALRTWSWDSLHGWLALSWSILQPRGLYNHWAPKATCTIRALRLYGETSTSWNILQAPRLYNGSRLIKLHVQSGHWDCKGQQHHDAYYSPWNCIIIGLIKLNS